MLILDSIQEGFVICGTWSDWNRRNSSSPITVGDVVTASTPNPFFVEISRSLLIGAAAALQISVSARACNRVNDSGSGDRVSESGFLAS